MRFSAVLYFSGQLSVVSCQSPPRRPKGDLHNTSLISIFFYFLNTRSGVQLR